MELCRSLCGEDAGQVVESRKLHVANGVKCGDQSRFCESVDGFLGGGTGGVYRGGNRLPYPDPDFVVVIVQRRGRVTSRLRPRCPDAAHGRFS
jgi:hypothetical protein